LLSGVEEKEKRSSKELKPLPEGAKELSFTISITGSYGSLKSFLSGIEQMRRPPKIDNATINASETESGRILVLIVSGRLPYIE
jgi:Tfp pilus assembly protein PilO